MTGLFSWVLSSIIRDRGVIRGLLFVCAALVASSLLANVCRYLSQRILVGMETRLMKNLRSALFDKILSLLLREVDPEEAARIKNRYSPEYRKD